MSESQLDALDYLRGVEASFRHINESPDYTASDIAQMCAMASANAAAATGHGVAECSAALRDLAAAAQMQLIATVLTTRCVPLDEQESRHLESKLRVHLGLGDR